MSRIRYLDIDELNDRLLELEDLRTALEDAKAALEEHEEPEDGSDDVEREDLERAVDEAEAAFAQPEQDELKKLEELRDDIGERGGKICDDHGPFIHENDFEDYARDLAEDLGSIPSDASWPCTRIDWERAADELKMDYTSVEWDGVTYYYRA